MARPLTNANRLTDELNAVMHSEEPVTNFQIAKFRRDAQSLLQVNPEAGYDALGMVAALSLDVEESIANHRRAIRLNPHSDVLNLNFAVSLGRLGRMSQAIYYCERVLELEPDQDTCNYVNSILFDYYFKAGHVKKAKAQFENVSIDEENREHMETLHREVGKVYEFMGKHALSDADLSRYLEQLEKLASDRSLPFVPGAPFASDTDEAALICICQRIVGDSELASEMNTVFADYMARQEVVPENVTDFISGSFIAAEA